MGALSHDQFAQLVNDGGASRLIHSNEQVKAGTPEMKNLYAVGQQGIHGWDNLAHPVLRDIVAEHHAGILADAKYSSDPAAMQGGWPDPPHVSLDASMLRQGRKPAVAEGRKEKQIAVYDMHNDNDVYTTRELAKERLKDGQRIRGSRATGFRIKDKATP